VRVLATIVALFALFALLVYGGVRLDGLQDPLSRPPKAAAATPPAPTAARAEAAQLLLRAERLGRALRFERDLVTITFRTRGRVGGRICGIVAIDRRGSPAAYVRERGFIGHSSFHLLEVMRNGTVFRVQGGSWIPVAHASANEIARQGGMERRMISHALALRVRHGGRMTTIEATIAPSEYLKFGASVPGVRLAPEARAALPDFFRKHVSIVHGVTEIANASGRIVRETSSFTISPPDAAPFTVSLSVRVRDVNRPVHIPRRPVDNAV
jgi:hypothetical protein